VTIAEAAGILGVPERTVRDLAQRGELSGAKIGRRWTFDLGRLRDYVQNKETQAWQGARHRRVVSGGAPPREPYKTASGQFKRLVKSVDRQAQKQARETPGQAHSFRSFRFHDLRHRHAVDWLKSGRSIYDLQLRLGHTSVKTTEIYLAYLTGDEQRIVKYGPSTEGTKSGTDQTVSPNRKDR
jgi:integrase/recombinase XerD